MNIKERSRLKSVFALLVGLLLIAAPTFAAEDFFLYGNQDAGDVTTASLIEAGGGETDPNVYSWFTAVDYFRSGPYKGRMISATGSKVYIQSATDPEAWTEIGSVTYTMDPSFIKVSPDGSKIALGMGFGKPLLVLPSFVAENSTPATFFELEDPDDPESYVLSDGVTMHDVNYYDAAWAPDNRHLVVNGGEWPGPPYGSGVISLDTQDGSTMGLIKEIPGASASIAVDENFNLVTGIGYCTSPNRTGELKVWKTNEWWNGGAMTGGDYDDQGRILATNALSSAYLGFDPNGNLCVGGGDAFGVGGPSENGYAALISHKVMERVVAAQPGEADPVNEANGAEYRQFAPDPCQNDSATGIIAFDGGISVSWNPTNEVNCTPGSAKDYWQDGIVASLTTYKINTERDGDNDGNTDCEDHSPNTFDPDNIDSDGDGYGNIIDADFNNDGIVNATDFNHWRGTYGSSNANTDLNGDGIVNATDFNKLRSLYGKKAPFYNF
ncbi:MAG: hypothetical protein JEZ12_26805 [Desulfobacterium sp.]|nr:hypothetical protein [Desulfobacterium sp.]